MMNHLEYLNYILNTIHFTTRLLFFERDREILTARVKLERYNYYTGKAPAEVYVEEPFPYKVREKDAIQRHLEADEKLSAIDMKIRYYDVMLKFLGRDYQNSL